MIIIKTKTEIERIKDAGKIVNEALLAVGEIIRPGVTTAQIDALVEAQIKAEELAAAQEEQTKGFGL